MRGFFSLPGTLLALQLTTILASLAAIALFPPSNGTMMLVPLSPGAEQGLAARTVTAGAQIVGRGPLPNSLVVSGASAALAPAMLASGVLVVAGPGAGCGTPAQ